MNAHLWDLHLIIVLLHIYMFIHTGYTLYRTVCVRTFPLATSAVVVRISRPACEKRTEKGRRKKKMHVSSVSVAADLLTIHSLSSVSRV